MNLITSRHLVASLLILPAVLSACGEDPKPATPAAPAPSTAPAARAGEPAVGKTEAAAPANVDTSTPLATMQSFVAAVKANDTKAVQACIHSEAHVSLRNLAAEGGPKGASQRHADNIAGGTLGSTKVDPNGATVELKFKNGEVREAWLVKVGERWLLQSL